MATSALPDNGRVPNVSGGLTLRPIGYMRTQKQVKFHALHQPSEAPSERNLLELLPDCGYEQALCDLVGFSRVWLLWWFHLNPGWRPLVLPPRGSAQRRGVFSTRSPHRPNPIGMTPVPLIAVEGRRLILGACDLVDGTPVFDIKPYYVPYDSFPESTGGWIEDVETAQKAPPQFVVSFSPLAETQAEWLRSHWEIDFRVRMVELLTRDPSPHRTRRIRRLDDQQRVIGCGAWRAVFGVGGNEVRILALEAAYPKRFLLDPARQELPDAAAQLAYLEIWPERPPKVL